MDDFDFDDCSIEFLRVLKEVRRKKRRYYWNDSIQSKDKSNMINWERKRVNPSVIINNKIKRVGINKTRSRFTADDDFNEMNK